MDSVPQTTFIPRKPVSDAAETRHAGGTVFLAFGSVLLAVAVLVSAGLFAYQNFYLQKDLTTVQANLHSYVQDFDSDQISQMATLSGQLATAKSVLDQHLTLIPIFNFLSANTLVPVQFTSFSYSVNNGVPTLSLSGSAAGFAALDAEQSQLSLPGNLLSNPVISGISLSKTGNATFSVSGTLSAAALSYENQNQSASSTAAPLSQ